MKKIILIICFAIIYSCNDHRKVDKNITTTNIETKTLEGAWKLVSYINYGEDGTADTILS